MSTGQDVLPTTRRRTGVLAAIRQYRFIYLLILPGILYFIVFHYIPMFGIVIAFKDINPFIGFRGIVGGEWVGLKHFAKFFSSIYAGRLIRNTFVISFLKLVFMFPAQIVLALLINELLSLRFKKIVQTISYLPHFISWVVVAGLTFKVFSGSDGLVNYFIVQFGREPIIFLGESQYFRGILVLTHVWKSVGWGTIIILAALAGVNPELYESAYIDGANKLQQILYITLPSIAMVITILLIFGIGRLLNAGFEQILLLYSPGVYEVADIIDTYVYREGLQRLSFSYAAAVGLFRSAIALILIVTANVTAKRLGQEGIW